jgi:hypothetical protein
MVRKSNFNLKNILFGGTGHASTSSSTPWLVWMPPGPAKMIPRCRESKNGRKCLENRILNETTYFSVVLVIPTHQTTFPASFWCPQTTPKSPALQKTRKTTKNGAQVLKCLILS